MLFNSLTYIFLFLPLVVLVYFLLNRQRFIFAAKAWLVLASLFFYGYWNPVYLVLIISSMVVNFATGTALHRTKRDDQSRRRKKLTRKSILIAGVAFNLSLLGYFKYADFFIENINVVFDTGIPTLGLVLPLAISFFTFQQIAYLVDSYQMDTQEYDFLNYSLFVSFFPQLIAGPIVHHKEMMPQFMKLKNSVIDWSNIAVGIFIFSMGLFKKVVIADSFAVWANAGFDGTQQLSFIEAWGTSLSYTFQIYYDFSGYSDMAIGAALFFNIRLPVNFNSPYKSLNIRDFWQRWHMTLSRWLRDYIYIPLGGNRTNNFHSYLNVLITFLLGGIWHGAGWMFVAWGAMHGIALTLHRIWCNYGLRLPAHLGWLITFLFVNMTWVFFRAESFTDAKRVLLGMAGLTTMDLFQSMESARIQLSDWRDFKLIDIPEALLSTYETFIYMVVFSLVAFLLPNTIQMIRFMPYNGKLLFKPSWFFAIVTGVVFFLAFMTFTGKAQPSEFLYFNF